MSFFDVLLAKQLSGGGGGGGDSDFSTATVTVVNDSNNTFQIGDAPYLAEAGELGEGAPACLISEFLSTVHEHETITKTVPLYKGVCTWMLSLGGNEYTTDGNIADFGDGFLLITGNGTITIS